MKTVTQTQEAGGTLIDLPVVANIDEAEQWALDFKSILTAGPLKSEVDWGHPNHKVYEFADSIRGDRAPKIDMVEEAIFWGADQEDLMVHCHAGMSRSTAISWGISIVRGADPLEAFLALREAQPTEGTRMFKSGRVAQKRDFIPNRLIVNHLDKIFRTGQELLAIRLEHAHSNWGDL